LDISAEKRDRNTEQRVFQPGFNTEEKHIFSVVTMYFLHFLCN